MVSNPSNSATRDSAQKAGNQAFSAKLPDQFNLILNWYKRSGNALAGEELLTDLQASTLLDVLENPLWNHVYHCWEVELKHMPELQPYIKHQFNPDKFVYFIEAYKA